jgi:hypothetical protein
VRCGNWSPLLRSHFDTQNNQFTRTGSGQACLVSGQLRGKRFVFCRAACRAVAIGSDSGLGRGAAAMGAKETAVAFWGQFLLNHVIILPRQARDKRWEDSKQEAFFARRRSSRCSPTRLGSPGPLAGPCHRLVNISINSQ